MRRLLVMLLATGTLWAATFPRGNRAVGATPAPSYVGVEQTIASIRETWSRPGAQADPNAPGWNTLFDIVQADLNAHTQAQTLSDKLVPLNRLYQVSVALAGVPWAPAQRLREELRQWLRPRVRLAWAERRLDETVRKLPATTDPAVIANRQRWVDFVENDLGKSLQQYDSAASVGTRREAIERIHHALDDLQKLNQARPWQPSWELQTAVNDLFNQPNLDVTADVVSVSPLFNQDLVPSGWVYRKGYWSYVTAGPKTGFGLLHSDNGIAFYNSQLFTSTTPITDFQNQIASDPQGQRAAKLYTFSATTIDQAELFITTILTTSGLQISPSYRHNIDALICSLPNAGKGLVRAFASLAGFDKEKITSKVREGALPQFQQRIPVEAQEEGEERTQAEAARRNADLRRFLVGNNTAVVQDFLIAGLSMQSRPEAAHVGGHFQWRGEPGLRGADAPQPMRLAVPNPGISADIHLSSVLTGVARSLYQRPEVQSTQNLMLVTSGSPAGTPPGGEPRTPPQVVKNVDFPTYMKAVENTKKPGPVKTTAIRFKRPPNPPEFGSDARGNLVVLVRELELEVPAPDQASRPGGVLGAPAKVLRIKMPVAEVALSYTVEPNVNGGLHVTGKVQDFTFSPNSEVHAINDDESKSTPLTRFSSALVLAGVNAQLRAQAIDTNVDNLRLPNVAIRSVSPLDPTGWVRLDLVPAQQAPVLAAAPVQAPDTNQATQQPVQQVAPAQPPIYQNAAATNP